MSISNSFFIVQSLTLVLFKFKLQPYTMRICVLSVLKELIIHVLNSEALEETEQKIRDDYLFILHDHLLDINAFVRSKVSILKYKN